MSNVNETYKKRVIHTENYDTVLNINLTQDVDILEILSLKINQKDLYKLHTSNYGMLVGRVLANDSFGIPNCKVSIFVGLEDIDKQNSEILNLYPYTNINSVDSKGRRYNLLPDENNVDACYSVVGTFPNKRLVLDDETVLEVFDKYWKYTTVTNECGDYFIASVPVGNCTVHVDFDISDIGILSQRPRDMIYKGYNITQFENANQFKNSTNLNGLSQLYSQNQVVYIYPFCGDDELNDIAITRCDIQIQYKFEPTCVFMGSIVSDTYSTAIGHNCKPFRTSGYNKTLIAGEGTIEMIRKTPDGFTEEFQIQGNRLIDGDGVWCYQIPMNLDYVKMDEFGNIVPTDDPTKGIPTRARVRFRLSMQESENDGISRHRAKYLIPNNPALENTIDVKLDKSNDKTLEGYYEFGSATDEESYRDLYWNNVYSVKNYIPRVQVSKRASSQNYTGLRTVNYSEDKNPIPFNKIRFRLSFTYRLTCIIATIVLLIIDFVNRTVIRIINNIFYAIAKIGLDIWFIHWHPFKFFLDWLIECIEFPFLSDSDEGACETKCYFPGCYGEGSDYITKKKNPDCDSIEKNDGLMKEKIEQLLAEENEAVNLDFYNDWLNGALYLPLWYWKKRRKKTFFFGLFSKKAINAYCNCDERTKLHLFFPCTFKYNKSSFQITNIKDNENRWHDKGISYFNINKGIIKEKILSNGLTAYYYANGVEDSNKFIRLFATDIILLGSLNDCDINGVPQMFKNLPASTSNVMPINRDVEEDCGTDSDPFVIQEITGMDFFTSSEVKSEATYGNGYFMDIGCSTLNTLPKTCVNAERLSELGVSLDMSYTNIKPNGSNSFSQINIHADGMVTRIEIEDNESRSMFATLNHNGLNKLKYNNNLGYYYYDFHYLYPIDFDGRMSSYSTQYTSSLHPRTFDYKNESYLLFRQGEYKHFYNESFPLYNNSFYFYFGLNEGNTAIEKFNKLYFSQCFLNKKYPFNLKYVTTPANVITVNSNCQYDSKKLGSIKIIFENIAIPYTYSIENSLGKKIVNNSVSDELVLNFDKYFTTNEPVINGIYTFTFIDANGDELIQIINLAQQPIYIDYETTNLSKKYYQDSKKDDFCGKFNGNIILNEVLVDNKQVTINKIEKLTNNSFKCIVNESSEYYVQLTINPMESQKDFLCDVSKNDENRWVIGIWVPGSYELVCEQKIYGLSDTCPLYESNISSSTFTIKNGKNFDLIVNFSLLRFILGKNYDNPNFMNNKQEYVNYNDSWLKVNQADIYAFHEFLDKNNLEKSFIDNIEYWEDAIDIDVNAIKSGSETDIKKGLFKAKIFQLQTVLNLSKAICIEKNNIPEVVFSHKGGVAPVIYKTYEMPNEEFVIEEVYDESQEEIADAYVGKMNTPIKVTIPEYKFDSSTGYIFQNELPNYVGSNYTIYKNNKWEKINESKINPLYPKDVWTYIGIYDNNGKGSYKCPPYIGSYDSNNVSKYFRLLSVDRRLDFNIPKLISNIKNNEIESLFTWNNGYVELHLINGIAMRYIKKNDSCYIYDNNNPNCEYVDDNGFIVNNTNSIPKFITAQINNNDVVYSDLSNVDEDKLHMDNRENYPTIDKFISHQLGNKDKFNFNIVACSYNTTIVEQEDKLEAFVAQGDSLNVSIQLDKTVICNNVKISYDSKKEKWNYFNFTSKNITISTINLLPDVGCLSDYLMLSQIPKIVLLDGNETEEMLFDKYNNKQGETAKQVSISFLPPDVSKTGDYLIFKGDYLYDSNKNYPLCIFKAENIDLKYYLLSSFNKKTANFVSVALRREFLPNRFLSKTVQLLNVNNTYDVRKFDIFLVDILINDNANSFIFEVFFPRKNSNNEAIYDYNHSLSKIDSLLFKHNNKTYNSTKYKDIFDIENNIVAKQYKFDNISNDFLSQEKEINFIINFNLYSIETTNLTLEPLY